MIKSIITKNEIDSMYKKLDIDTTNTKVKPYINTGTLSNRLVSSFSGAKPLSSMRGLYIKK